MLPYLYDSEQSGTFVLKHKCPTLLFLLTCSFPNKKRSVRRWAKASQTTPYSKAMSEGIFEVNLDSRRQTSPVAE